MLNFFGNTSKKKPTTGIRRAERRAEPRVDTSVSAEWRFKPVGKIASPWSKVVVNDLSRTSATMTCDRTLKPQEAIEIRTTLDGKNPIVLDTVIVRCDPAGPKFKVGLAFRHVDEESSHVITRFINKRMTELRGRGLV
jgi:PilZ domain